ncbi:MAG: STAS domain-containing protein [Solirubrobacterales bacterium]|nr:STAS domain-containing protein [Solirubrobacterales bacterium]
MATAADPRAAYTGALTARTHGVGAWAVVTLTGELDLATGDAARRELARAERETGLVLLDLRGISFMDSTGLHMVIDAARRLAERHGRLVLVDGPRAVHRIFEITGTINRLEIVRDPLEVLRDDSSAGGVDQFVPAF